MASQIQSTQQDQQQPQQQEKIREGNQELTLSTPIEELEVPCELMVGVDNLKENWYDLTEAIRT